MIALKRSTAAPVARDDLVFVKYPGGQYLGTIVEIKRFTKKRFGIRLMCNGKVDYFKRTEFRKAGHAQ